MQQLSVLKEHLRISEGKLVTANETILELNLQLCASNNRIAFLESSVQQRPTISETIKNEPKAVSFFTGIDSYEKLWMMFNWILKFVPKEDKRVKLSYFDQFCLTLMKLRLNSLEQDLAYRFRVAVSTVSKYIHFWIHAMYVCYVPALITWPTRENMRGTVPLFFRDKFFNCVCIIDCFEIFCQRPIKVKERASTYSTYKSHNTVKYLIAVTPQGTVSFISKGYGGRCRDKFIVEDSGFLEHLIHGDLVMADRGFTVHEAIALRDANLAIPSFLGKRTQLSNVEVEYSRGLARIRVHVERIIGATKQRFSILQGPLHRTTLGVSKGENTAIIDKIVMVCCALYNSCPSVVPLT